METHKCLSSNICAFDQMITNFRTCLFPGHNLTWHCVSQQHTLYSWLRKEFTVEQTLPTSVPLGHFIIVGSVGQPGIQYLKQCNGQQLSALTLLAITQHKLTHKMFHLYIHTLTQRHKNVHGHALVRTCSNALMTQ